MSTGGRWWPNKSAADCRCGPFCEQAEGNEHTFYNWRARQRQEEPVRFALVEPITTARTSEAIEVTLSTGERVRIGAGAGAATVRVVLAALRA